MLLLVMLILCYQWSCRVGTQEGHCVPFLLETQHVSAWENNIEVIVILNVSKMSIYRQDTHVKLFSSSSSKD